MLLETPKVDLRPQTTQMTVLAGGSAEQLINVINMTVLPDDFDIRMEGLPEGWYSFDRTSVNLFPNWSDAVKLRLDLSVKVRPNLYVGRVTVASRSQPMLRSEFRLEIKVLAPLKFDARLDPTKAKGYKADYGLIIRNRSMCDGLMTLQLINNEFCEAHFAQEQVRVPAGQSEVVKMQVTLRPKVPDDQARVPQSFEVQIQPQWLVEQQTVTTPAELLEGEYLHTSRWDFILRNPKLFIILGIFLAIALLWSILIVPAIRTFLLTKIDVYPAYQGTSLGQIRVEQNEFSQAINNNNPFGLVAAVKIEFEEKPIQEQLEKGAEVKIYLIYTRFMPLTIHTDGYIKIVNGKMTFTPKNKGEDTSFPWFFMPPKEVINKFNTKIYNWLNTQPAKPRLTGSPHIEGNTLYLPTSDCVGGRDTLC